MRKQRIKNIIFFRKNKFKLQVKFHQVFRKCSREHGKRIFGKIVTNLHTLSLGERTKKIGKTMELLLQKKVTNTISANFQKIF